MIEGEPSEYPVKFDVEGVLGELKVSIIHLEEQDEAKTKLFLELFNQIKSLNTKIDKIERPTGGLT